MSTQVVKATPINALPDDILGGAIFPYLIDPEDPRPIATLSQVCKRWNAVMGKNLPYAVALREGQGFTSYSDINWLRCLGFSQRSVYRICPTFLEMQDIWKGRLDIRVAEAREIGNALFSLALSIYTWESNQELWNLFWDLKNEEISLTLLILKGSAFCLANCPKAVQEFERVDRHQIYLLLVCSCLLPLFDFGFKMLAAGEIWCGDTCLDLPIWADYAATFFRFCFSWVLLHHSYSACKMQGHSLLSKAVFDAASAVASCRPLAERATSKAKAVGIRLFASLKQKCSAAYSWLFPRRG